jgi:regulator of cell morphogenesis and NO signaling
MASFRDRLQDIARKASARLPVPQAVRSVLQRAGIDGADAAATKAAPAAAAAAAPEVAPVSVVIKQPNWEQRTQAELVDHIVDHFHAALHRDLPTLVEAARRLEREHAAHPAVPTGLADELAQFASELESHMLKEENVLFPMLRTGARGGQLDMPIRMMERDHDDHADGLERIRRRTGDHRPPADASASWIDLYGRLTALETELRQHIYLEDNILFARAVGPRE